MDKLARTVLETWIKDDIKNYNRKLQEWEDDSFITKMLRKKFKVFNIPIELPDALCILLDICTNGNPGLCQVMLKEILTTRKGKTRKIMACDFLDTYGYKIPIISGHNEWYQHFETLWKAQKNECGDNLCDTVDWWIE